MATATARVSVHDYPDKVWEVRIYSEGPYHYGEAWAVWPDGTRRMAYEEHLGWECYQYDWEFYEGDWSLFLHWQVLLDTVRKFARRPLWEKMGLDVRA